MTIQKNNKTAFNWSGTIMGFLGGAGLASPIAALMISNALNISQIDAQKIIQYQPEKAQQIINSVPPETFEQLSSQTAGQETSQFDTPDNQPENSMVSAEQVAPFIAQWEGKEPYSYPDGDSRSVGYGFYLGNSFSKSDIERVGADYEAVFSGKQPLNDGQMNQLLQLTSQRAIDDALRAVPDLSSHPQEVQIILVDMAHTLGNKISFFPKLLKALRERDYAKAATEMQDSKWFSQTGRRSRHHVQQMNSLATP